MSLLPILVLTASCQLGGDPATRAASDYITELQPLLQENSLLAERVLYQAAAIYNDATRPDEVADAWTGTIVPLSEHLHDQASFVVLEEGNPWAERHEALVAIWGERAHAYRSISEGLERADRERWDEGRKLADEVKVKEEQWFDEMNTQVTPLGFVVDAYP